MTDHRSTPDDPATPDEDQLEPVSGEPVDATFEVEHVGADDTDPDPSDEPDPVESAGDGEDAEFELAPQTGESPPPVVAGGSPGTADDDEEWPWDAGAPTGPVETEPPADPPAEPTRRGRPRLPTRAGTPGMNWATTPGPKPCRCPNPQLHRM